MPTIVSSRLSNSCRRTNVATPGPVRVSPPAFDIALDWQSVNNLRFCSAIDDLPPRSRNVLVCGGPSASRSLTIRRLSSPATRASQGTFSFAASFRRLVQDVMVRERADGIQVRPHILAAGDQHSDEQVLQRNTETDAGVFETDAVPVVSEAVLRYAPARIGLRTVRRSAVRAVSPTARRRRRWRHTVLVLSAANPRRRCAGCLVSPTSLR